MLLGLEVLVASSYQGKVDGDRLHNSHCTICRYICFRFFLTFFIYNSFLKGDLLSPGI